MIFSIPSNAPPTINKIFLVSIFTLQAEGLRREVPEGGTETTEPSIIFKRACCTPSPDTSRVIERLRPFLAILSISSRNTIPCSAFLTSPSAASINLCRQISGSEPTSNSY